MNSDDERQMDEVLNSLPDPTTVQYLPKEEIENLLNNALQAMPDTGINEALDEANAMIQSQFETAKLSDSTEEIRFAMDVLGVILDTRRRLVAELNRRAGF